MWSIIERNLPVFFGNRASLAHESAEARSVNLANCTPTDLWGQPSDWDGNGTSVTQISALSVPAVWDSVKKISETLASLPFDLFVKTENGSEPAEDHPVRYLIRSEPSPYMSAYDFRRALFASACFGDAFAKIHRNGIGRPKKLEIMTGNVSVHQKDNGEVFYKWDWTRGSKNGSEVLMPFEVIHLKGITLNGIAGLSVLSVHKDTLGMAIGANKYGNAFFANNASIDKVVTTPAGVTSQQATALQKKIDAVSGVKKTGSALVLDGGMDIKTIGLSPEDSMLNQTRGFQVNETSRLFGVPVHILQNMDRATFNSIELMTTLFVTLCLRPWAVCAEQEFFIKLLTSSEKMSDRYFFRHNFEGLLRGDTAARSSFYASAILNGYMTRNEVREKENMNTIEGLDKPLVPVNMSIVGEDGSVEAQDQTQTSTKEAGNGGKKNDDGTKQNESGG